MKTFKFLRGYIDRRVLRVDLPNYAGININAFYSGIRAEVTDNPFVVGRYRDNEINRNLYTNIR
jgi:hypothetical protein